MPSPSESISRRKAEHIASALDNDVTATISAGWDDITLVHNAVPEIDKNDIDLSVTFLGRRLRCPLLISALTGGHDQAMSINRNLGLAAERFGLAMGVGSQRAMAAHSELAPSYTVARASAPTAFVIANVGAPQLVAQDGTPPVTLENIRSVVDQLGADALAIHLNYLQECVQQGGDTDARGVLDAIEEITSRVEIPVIAKETGNGMSREAGLSLGNAGVKAIDVGGAGGSSMALLEANRSQGALEKLGRLYSGWGVPTAASLHECSGLGLPLIATGGIRSGLDAAKALSFGATLVGVGRPMLEAAAAGEEPLFDLVESLIEELRLAMFLTGAPTVSAMRRVRRIVKRDLKVWIDESPAPERPPLP